MFNVMPPFMICKKKCTIRPNFAKSKTSLGPWGLQINVLGMVEGTYPPHIGSNHLSSIRRPTLLERKTSLGPWGFTNECFRYG